MKKRLIVGLAAGALVVAMLPGVATAGEPTPFGQCIKQGVVSTPNKDPFADHVGKRGEVELWAGPIQAYGGLGKASDAGGAGLEHVFPWAWECLLP